jgi:hypothetical protein
MAPRRKFDPEEDPDELEERLEEEGNYDSNGLLKDGHRVRVPLYMRDGAINPNLTPTQQAKAAAQQQIQDAAARKFGLSDALQLHKPGFRYNTWDADAQERTRQAYADADTADANAWKNSSAPTPGAGGQSRNPPNNQRRDAPAMDAKAQAYATYDEEMQNAWRSSK